MPTVVDRLLDIVGRALVLVHLLAVALAGAIAVRGSYGPLVAVGVLWSTWVLILGGLAVYVLLVEQQPRKARR